MDTISDTLEAEPPGYPMARAADCPFDPPPALRELQQQTSIRRVRIWDGSSPWLVTGFEDQRVLLSDPRLSADGTNPGFPYDSPAIAGTSTEVAPDTPPGDPEPKAESIAFINMDDPEHARQRRMISGAFTVKRVETMRPAIQRIVDDLIDAMLAGPKPVDLVEAFALPVPSLVICELLGVPYADHDFFQTRSSLLTTAEVAVATFAELDRYLDRLISDRLTHPAGDLLSTMAERVTARELTQHQATNMSLMLLFGGHETTANMIALGTLALLQHPDQLARVREHSDDTALIASTVEELLRYLSIPQTGRRRVALADIEIGGVTIHAGDGVILANDIANRDPSIFTDPDRLDIDRNPRQQLAFGFGIHQCLGQPLARLELVYSTLYRRIPTLRLATEFEQIPFKNDGFIYGAYELPVTW
jgi:cytochrome P450